MSWKVEYFEKIVLFSLLFSLSACVTLICILAAPYQGDKNQIYRNLVNSDFSITLDQTNSSVVFDNSILSRDSIYVIHFDLTPEYACFLDKSAMFQNGNMPELMQQYVEPYIHSIDGLDVMIQESKTAHCLIASNIREDNDFSKSFSILLLNMEKNMLYWFYYTS